jgi:hypothetical protein
MEARLNEGPLPQTGASDRDFFLAEWEKTEKLSGHIKAVSSLSPSARKSGAAWLQGIVDSATSLWKS